MSYEVDIIIPKFSDEIDDVKISNWLKSIGEVIEFGESIIELEVNKSNVEIDSPTAGVLAAVYCWEGEEVIAGERIGVIEVDEDELLPEIVKTDNNPDSIKTDESENDEKLHDNLDNVDEENMI